MSEEDEYLKQLIKRAEELMVTQTKDESLKKIPAPNAPHNSENIKTKQKRFYSEEQKQKLRERLELARAKSKEVRELKKNIGQIKSIEKKEEKEEKKAKFNEQSLEEKIEKIKQHRQYNPPKEEIQGPILKTNLIEKPEPQPAPAPAPAPPPTLLTSSISPAPAPAPVGPPKPKYFMPSMKFVTKHKLINQL